MMSEIFKQEHDEGLKMNFFIISFSDIKIEILAILGPFRI